MRERVENANKLKNSIDTKTYKNLYKQFKKNWVLLVSKRLVSVLKAEQTRKISMREYYWKKESVVCK